MRKTFPARPYRAVRLCACYEITVPLSRDLRARFVWCVQKRSHGRLLMPIPFIKSTTNNGEADILPWILFSDRKSHTIFTSYVWATCYIRKWSIIAICSGRCCRSVVVEKKFVWTANYNWSPERIGNNCHCCFVSFTFDPESGRVDAQATFCCLLSSDFKQPL